ncbi:MAG: glycosyltransferase [Chromatiales bacterium]|nr:glycosyltransferase [Chromatiales bacterium]
MNFDGSVDVLIPARNEAETIESTVTSVLAQGDAVRVIVIDDQSTDATGEIVAALDAANVMVIEGRPLPSGWSGKVWALAQAEEHLERPYVWLLDADIEVEPGLLNGLLERLGSGTDSEVGPNAGEKQVGLVSLMAQLPMQSFVECALLPAFVYFFKLLYPFALSNNPRSRVAAAAGGCVLLRREALLKIGGFASLRSALIDDCTLARLVKGAGYPIWTGLSRNLHSRRASGGWVGIWSMVSRNAYTQLGYTWYALVGCTVAMVAAYSAPVVALFAEGWVRGLALATWLAMALNLLPTLRFYSVNVLMSLALPFIAWSYLLMTWSSAFAYWGGRRSRWKTRDYAAH